MKIRIFWLALIAITVFSAYSSGFSIPYYGDDFKFFFSPDTPNPFYHFSHANPNNAYAYRPIEAAILFLIQSQAGLDPLLVHLFGIGLHIILAGMVFSFLRRAGFPLAEAMTGALFMGIAQAGVHAVLSNDTMSQLLGTVWGYSALWLLARSYSFDRGVSASLSRGGELPFRIASVIAFAFSLLSKETSVGFLPALLLIAGIGVADPAARIFRWKRFILDTLPYMGVFGGYMLARILVVPQQPEFGSGTYSFHIGLNIAKNLGMLAVDMALPVSTEAVFVAVKQGNMIMAGAAAAGTVLFLGIVAWGLVHTRRKLLMALFGTLTLIGSFPVVLMNHVNELYLYTMLPAFSVLVGVGVCGAVRATSRIRMRLVLLVMVAVLGVSHVFAIRGKAALMQENGIRADRLIRQVSELVHAVPPGGKVLLLNEPGPLPDYSIYRLHGFSVLKYGTRRILQVAKRNDIQFEIIDGREVPREMLQEAALVLGLDGQTVKILREK